MNSAAVLDRRRVLAGFYAVGALTALVPVVLPGSAGVDTGAMTVIAALAGLTATGLLLARELPVWGAQSLLLIGDVVIAWGVVAGGGGSISATYALVFGWVTLYAALFLSTRSIICQVLAALVAAVVALRLAGDARALLNQVLVLSIVSGASAAIVALLIGRLRAAAGHDDLTGLLNRSGLLQAVEDSDVLAGSRAGALVVDLARFHAVNASLGQEYGDQLLREVAGTLRAAAPAGALVARVGGDEFALVVGLPALRRDGDLRGAADRLHAIALELLAAVRGPVTVAGLEVEVEARVGTAVFPEHGVTAAALLLSADGATRHADQQPDRVASYVGRHLLLGNDQDPVRGGGVDQGDIVLLAELRVAIARGELRLHYQPLVDARTHTLVGVEALVRWQHPVHGLLPPSRFVPQAEPTLLIVALTEWVLAEALRQTASWRAAGLMLSVSVNLSARLLLQPDLPEMVRAVLDRHDVPPGVLVLEVTESAVMAVPERAQSILAELAAFGIRISIDDFGTGYTSLALLAALPVHELKIDRSFITGCAQSSRDLAIVRSVLELGHRLHLSVLAEGVEDAATAQLLAELGMDVLQGDHLGRPATAGRLLGGGHREFVLPLAGPAAPPRLALVPDDQAAAVRADGCA